MISSSGMPPTTLEFKNSLKKSRSSIPEPSSVLVGPALLNTYPSSRLLVKSATGYISAPPKLKPLALVVGCRFAEEPGRDALFGGVDWLRLFRMEDGEGTMVELKMLEPRFGFCDVAGVAAF